ncbi:MAG TPA: carbon storage regulator [Porticoccaceae bacterium]
MEDIMEVIVMRAGESIGLGNGIRFVITHVEDGSQCVRLGVEAPFGMTVVRGELLDNSFPSSPMESDA